MDAERAILALNQKLSGHRQGKGLSEAEVALIKGTLARLTYAQIAETTGFASNSLHRSVAPTLFRELSAVFKTKVTKANLKQFLADLLAAPPAPLPSHAPQPIQPPRLFYGRERELSELLSLLNSGFRMISLTGLQGIGKKSLALALQAHASTQLDLATRWVTCTASTELKLNSLLHDLQMQPTLLVLAELDALAKGKALKLLNRLIQIIEESPTTIIATSVLPIDGFEKIHYLKTIGYPVKGLDLEAAHQIFREIGLDDDPLAWQQIHSAVGGSPLLIRQIANWAKSMLGGRLAEYRPTIQFGVIQDWLQTILSDPDYIGTSERAILQELNRALRKSENGVEITRFIGSDPLRVGAINKLIQMGLIQTDPTARLSLNPMICRYLQRR